MTFTYAYLVNASKRKYLFEPTITKKNKIISPVCCAPIRQVGLKRTRMTLPNTLREYLTVNNALVWLAMLLLDIFVWPAHAHSNPRKPAIRRNCNRLVFVFPFFRFLFGSSKCDQNLIVEWWNALCLINYHIPFRPLRDTFINAGFHIS